MRPRRTGANPVRWAFVLNTGRRSINMAFTLVLAAMLGPRPFGIVAMAMVYVAVLELVLEQGLPTALIQRTDLDLEHLDSAFWMSLVWCLFLAGVSVALSGWWAELNNTPELADVIKVLSLALPLGGLLLVQQAILVREMDFKTLAIRSNAASLVGGCVGVATALAGGGVWSLVAQQLTMDAVGVALLWALSTWRPRFRFSPSHARELLGFSSDVFFANLGNFISRRSDALLMGIFFGPYAVGLYRMADRFVEVLLDLTTKPIATVSLPLLSRLKDDPPALRESLTAYFRTTLLLTVPAMLLLAATSENLFAVMGEEWVAASDALMLLAVVGIFQAVALFTAPVLYALARPRLRAALVWTLAPLSAASVLVVGAWLETASIGDQLFGLATSRVVLFAGFFAPLCLGVMLRLTGLSLRSVLAAAWMPLLAGGLCYGAVAAVRATGVIDGLPPLLALLLLAAVGALVAVATLLVLDERLRKGALRLRWPRGRRSAAADPPGD